MKSSFTLSTFKMNVKNPKVGFSLINLLMNTIFKLSQKEPARMAVTAATSYPILEEIDTNSCIEFSPQNYQSNLTINNDSLSKLKNLAMNQLSYQNDSTVKSYQIGSFYDEKTKSWSPKLTESNIEDGPNLINEMKGKSTSSTKKTAFRWATATILLVLFAILGAFAQADIRIGKLVSNDKPLIGNTITYTLYAKNEGTSAAADVVIKDNFPTSGATPNLAGIVAGAGTFDTGTFEWTIPSLAVGDSVAVTIPATVIAQGVFFNTAEVKSMTGVDVDSSPNNSSLVEDDFAAACFSVPLYWYVGDEYTVSVPAPYKYGATIKWFRNGVEITSTTPEAVVNADTSLTIKQPGTYTFTTNISTCPAQGCCAVEIIQGPYGSIGDYVWKDQDNDGIQDSTEPGVEGVTVELYKVDGSGNIVGSAIQTVQTASNGKYLFDSLFTDTYKVKIVTSALPDTCKLTAKVDLGGDDTQDSDFDSVSGLSPPISINVDSTGNKKDNLTIDAGLYVPVGTIGDFVWKDTDNDGIQDAGELGVEGVILELYAADASGNPIGSFIAKDTTNAVGFYEFINIKKGDYVVKVVTSSLPADCTISTKTDEGGDDTKDSDFTAAGLSPKISLNPGDESNSLNVNNPTIDLGVITLGTIGDYVWNDTDNDGVQDGGESGVAGIIIELYAADASGTPVGAALAKDTTDAVGFYQFKDLIKGDYVVKIVSSSLPSGFIISTQDAGSDDTKDSDFNATTGLSQLVSLDPTNTGGDPLKKDNPTIDGGIYSPMGSIGDYVWKDADNDGIQDASESGAAGVVIELYASDASGTPIGVALKKDTTDTNGAYLFSNLPSGDYVIKVLTNTLPTDCQISTLPNEGGDDTKDSDVSATTGLSPKITITTINPATPTDKDNNTIDVGLYTPAGTIGDYVWKDADNDGVQDSGELGVSGVIMELYAADASGNPTGSVLKKDTTDASGFYQFTDVLKGDYVVKLVTSTLPADCKLSGKEDLGGDDTKDNDFGTDGLSQVITFDPSNTTDPLLKNNPTIDAAVITTGTIGDYVWKDADNDGIQDASEVGAAGVIIELYAADASGNTLGVAIAKDTTDANGFYQFKNLDKGDYIIKVLTNTLPTDCQISTLPNEGGDDTKDSDVSATTGLSPVITLDPANAGSNPLLKDNNTIDVGLYTPAGTIGDYVWKDADNDGVQDSGELGVSGVIMELYAADASGNPTGSVLKKDTTDASGFYQFTDVLKGDYVVKLVTSTLPADCKLSGKEDLGGDDTKDNDFGTDGLSQVIAFDPSNTTDPLLKNNPTIDAAVITTGTIGDYVWKDADNDGIQDASEVGVAGVIVELYAADASGNPVGAAIAKDTTDASGLYGFVNLDKGDYVVKIITSTLPTDCQLTTLQNEGSDDTKDSDFASTGLSPVITLDPANAGSNPLLKDNNTVDAGVRTLGTIGDYVWKDLNNDGIQDAGETGAEGVVIELYISDASGNTVGAAIAKDTTDASGFYQFTQLPKGDYVIKVLSATLPVGCALSTKQDLGGDDTKDSDIDDATGLSPKITIDPDNAGGDPLKKNNPTIDVAVYTPVFDLALRKTSNATSVVAGQDITFTIEVFNQGNIDATDIQITDYIPAGLTLNDLDWVDAGDKATMLAPLSLAAGASTTVDITFTVGASVTGSITNVAEISSAKDPQGNTPTDVDSTPDNDPSNDGTAKDDVINENGKTGGDEDDSDPSTITVTAAPVFDLALRKTPPAISTVKPGESVTFNIEVINQGTVTATDIVVADYIPAGFTLDDPNWDLVSGIAYDTIPGPLAGGSSMTLTIQLKVNENVGAVTLTNVSEIADAKDGNGNLVTDVDSTPDNNPSNDGTAKDDVVNENGKTGGDEDDSDPAQITVRPLFGTIGDYVWSDTDNDGIQDAGENGVQGVILELYASDASGNPVGSAIAKDTTDAVGFYQFTGLEKGDYVVKIVNSSIPSIYYPSTNTNAGGDDTKDSDFNPTTLLSQKITLDPNNADSDPLLKDNPTIDAALVILGTIGDYVWKDTDNDGIQDAGETGAAGVILELYASDANGTPTGSVIAKDTTDAVGFYQFTKLPKGDYVVKVLSNTLPSGCALSAQKDLGGDDTKDSDIDSITGLSQKITLDPANAGSDPLLRNNPTIDVAVYTPVFDLALRKTSVQTSVVAGSDVTFTISVFNQGNVDAKDIQITDYVPTGLTLNDADWSVVSGNATLNTPIANLAAGASTTVDITFTMGASVTGSIVNVAEISSAKDPQGNTPTDVDSTPDNDPSNDGTAKDDVINENGKTGGDEDDSDPSTITVTPAPVFDLALRKTSVQTSVVAGSDVTFTISVFNQGNVDAKDIQITDYVPTGLTLNDSDWSVVSGKATLNTPIASLAAGASTTVEITFTVGASVTGSLVNIAEISSAKDPQGNTPTDVDSTPDNDPSNDGTAKDDVINENGKTGGDEDDSDPSTITVTPAPVFDLALRKTSVQTSVVAGSDVTFTISVFNQGNVDAKDIQITDYVPTGLTLNDADWSVVSGKATLNTPIANLAAGASTTVDITFTVGASVTGSIVNVAEISSAKDPQGNTPTDVDSTPDNNPSNDGTAKDDVINENGKTGGDEDDSDPSTITVTPRVVCPELTASVTDGDICVGDTTYIKGITTNGARIKWYLTPIGGTPIATTESGVNYMVYPTTTTTYYAEIENIAQGCDNTRQPVIVVVNARPSTPTCTGVVDVCEGIMVDLNQYVINGITTPGGAFEWHTGANPNSPFVTNPMSVGAGTYYLFEKSGAGCYSNPTQLKIVYKTCEKLIDLSLQKVASATTVNQGDNVTYTISVTNAGPDAATNVEVKDVLPAGLQFVSSSNFTNSAGTLTASIATINAGQSVSLTFVAKVTGTGAITNFAEVSKADQKDTDSTPNNGQAAGEDDGGTSTIQVITPELKADLTLNKTVSNANPTQGDQITYFITVTNNGPDNATNVEVTDVVPAGLQVISAVGGDASSVSGNTVIAKFNEITAGQTVQLSIIVKVTGSGTIKNIAEVTKSDQKDPDSTPNNGGGVTTDEDDDDSEDITIKVPCNPITPIIACLNPYICTGESTTLSAIGCNGVVLWSDGQTGATITVSPSATTQYSAVCKVGECTSPKSNSITVVVNTTTPPVVSASSTSICSGASVTLSATGCTGSIIWSNGQSGASIIVSPTTTTEYSAVCKKATCTSVASDKIKVTVGASGEGPVISTTKNSICTGESTTITATNCSGTVVWSNGQSGTSISVSPTTTTTYSAVCKIGNCTSLKSNDVTISVGAGNVSPTISASKESVCVGESVTLKALDCAGTVQWNTGETIATITVNPAITTTYTVTCKVNGCEGTASKTITVGTGGGTPPTITSNKDGVCEGESVILTAAGCTGTLTWNTGATTASITVIPTTTTTYTATCINTGSCGGTASKTITVTPKPVPPIVTCGAERICAGESLTFTAHNCDGLVIWSTGATGSTMVVNPMVSTTYTATCTINGCTSLPSSGGAITVITETPTITASKEAICTSEPVTLTAGNCSGTLAWNTGATTASITVTPATTTTYTVTCKVENCEATASKTIVVGAGGGTPPVITASKDGICEGESVTLTAAGCSGTLTWSTGATTSSITVTPATTTTYTATCSNSGEQCSGISNKTITVTPKPVPPIVTCGSERICAGESLTFTAHNCDGLVTWSTGATGATMVVNPTVSTTYTATCTINGCTSLPSSGGAITVITETPTITASKETVCGNEPVTLTAAGCSGTLTWSNGETTVAITVTPATTTTYTVKCTVEGCEGTASKIITVGGDAGTPPTVTATKTTACPGETVTLTAAGCTGSVIWNTGATTSVITTTTSGTFSAKCVASGGACGSSESNVVAVTFGTQTAPVVSTSANGICEAGQVTLTATGCTGTVTWSNGSTGSVITPTVSATTTFTATCQSGNCTSPVSNSVVVTVGKPAAPTISAGTTTICAGGSSTLTATGCTGGTIVWSNGQTGNTVTVTPANTTEYTAVCKLPQGGCTSDASNKVTVTVINKPESPVITCTASRICAGDTLTLSGLGCTGTITWSNGQTGATININPTETTVYTAICKVGDCESAPSAAATITVGAPIPPVVTCKNTQICSGNSTQIEAAGCTGTVVWSDGQIGAVITVSPTTLTSYWAICDGGRCESEKSNVISVQVTGSGLAKPTTKDLVNVCPFNTVDLTTGVTSTGTSQGSIFVFRTGTTPGSPAVANPSAVGSGTYYVFEKAGNGCYSEAGVINVQITTCNTGTACSTNPATANAGKDSTLCLQANNFTLNGKIGGAASSAKWTSDGTGTFDNSLNLNAKYSFSNEDILKGSVKFVLTTNDPDDNGSCVAAKDTMVLTIKAVKVKPIIETDKSPNICFGDSVKLTAKETGYSYKWSNGATTQTITVKTTGRYSVQLIGQDGCGSISSDEIVVNVGTAIPAPSVVALPKNICPATNVNLNSAVTSQVVSDGGIFEFHTANSPTSPMLANASAVGAGTYYVFEKSGIGCYSAGASMTVSIDQCNVTTDTSKTDVEILIVGSRVVMKIDEQLTYTITVKNNGPKPATNVKVVNNLPKQQGLVLASSTPGLTLVGDSLVGTIANLAVGETRTYTYTATLKKAGKVINTAKITGVTPQDVITSNNISQWTVECLTCQEACIGLALSADTLRQSNGSYNVTFRAIVESCGNLKLEGVEIKENLASMFTSPATFTVIQKPTAGVGSKLVTNDSFNGISDTNLTLAAGSILEQGATDTVKFVINVIPNGNEGPFSTNATVKAMANTIFGDVAETSDVSNNGKVVDKPSAEPTVVRFFKSPSIGLALAVIDTVKQTDGSYNVTYQAIVKNNGSLELNGVVICDTLSKAIQLPATFTTVGTPTKNAGSELIINNAFNGSTEPCLTTSAGKLGIGKADTIRFVLNIKPDTLKTFTTQAVVSGTGTLANSTNQTVTAVSSAGTNPDSPSKTPTSVVFGSGGTGSISVPCIGLAMYVKDTVRQSDGSYNISYRAIIKNCGNLILKDITMCDTLSNTFTSPAVATIVQKPTLSAGSTLAVDTTFNGVTNTCMLIPAQSTMIPNKIDTVKWVVNVKLNDNKGPFRNNIKITAKSPSNQEIFDISNDGLNPNPEGSAATVVNFNVLPANAIGIAKEVEAPVKVRDNVYDLKFTFRVKNYGINDIPRVQVQDNLAAVFGDSVRIDSVKIVSVDQGFVANNTFTGKGNLINLLVDSLSTLPKNTTRNIVLFTRIDVSGVKQAKFENQALAIGRNGTTLFDDISTTGNDPDPDANGDPKNNSTGTQIDLGNVIVPPPVNVTPLGIAKAVDSTRNSDGSYNLKYTVVVRNYGTRSLTNIQLSDSLSKVFTDAIFALNGKPTLSAGSSLKLDSTFNGRDKTTFFIADSSSLAVGKSDTLTFTVAVANSDTLEATYSNTIYGTAKDSTVTVTDISQTGLNPDADGNNNPGNDNAPTVIKLKGKTSGPTTVGEIPGGFSPNGDNINDSFIIEGVTGTDKKAEVYIYNRWGHLVYKNIDFAKETNGWDGRPNSGVVVGNKDAYVPDGTYYYCVKVEGAFDDKPKFGFISIIK